jgi:hypothetical protein
MIESTDAARAEMLVLAALTYRGFSDLLSGELHEGIVGRQIAGGLEELAPVRGRWDLAWGPATTTAGAAFDSSAMYVARSRQIPQRYVVALRGTNPVSLTDWLLGDFVVDPTVGWPFGNDGAAISSSTAFGLRTLLGLKSGGTTAAAGLGVSIAGVLDEVTESARVQAKEIVRALDAHHGLGLRRLFAPIEQTLATALSDLAAALDLPQRVERRLNGPARVQSSELRPSIRSAQTTNAGQTLVEFLADAARSQPIDVVVTGHSKGAALASALALWLKETQGSEGWDPTGRSEIGCVTFAGPTPGNAAFARRIDSSIGEAHQRIANSSDVVTHAWQADQLRQIASLFGHRSQPFAALFATIVNETKGLDYQHPSAGVLVFDGKTDPARSFVQELIHQHLDAYLDRFGLLGDGIDALTLFFG